MPVEVLNSNAVEVLYRAGAAVGSTVGMAVDTVDSGRKPVQKDSTLAGVLKWKLTEPPLGTGDSVGSGVGIAADVSSP